MKVHSLGIGQSNQGGQGSVTEAEKCSFWEHTPWVGVGSGLDPSCGEQGEAEARD